MADGFLLGYVKSPDVDHAQFRGYLAIPSLNAVGVVAWKFRNLEASGPKYHGPTGQPQYPFNLRAIAEAGDTLVITEGELDAVALTAAAPVPVVAIPGASHWRPLYARLFDGISRVFILTDNDEKEDGSNPGQELALKISRDLPDAVNLKLPSGSDVNDTLITHGPQYLRDLIGL